MLFRLTFGALALLAAASPAAAADVARGEVLARRWCASCHLVAPDQARATPDTPSFAAIARRPDAPPLAAFLSASHARMPDMNLTRDEIADLSEYIRRQAP
ncbi:MAG: c-type cytochrome [Methylobacteriaceae bacterium]|nr:c-type cytochrome [Methylobacteriaceae bacterium]